VFIVGSVVSVHLNSIVTFHTSRFRANTSNTNPNQTNETNNSSSSDDSSTTHFGFRTIPIQEKVSHVAGVFDRVAQKYDLMNDVMSAGIHRIWKHKLIEKINPTYGMQLLDVAGGTGDIAFRFLDACQATAPMPALSSPTKKPPSSVIVCDINPNMLDVGVRRAKTNGFSCTHVIQENIDGKHHIVDDIKSMQGKNSFFKKMNSIDLPLSFC
jgi:hypothetical protein